MNKEILSRYSKRNSSIELIKVIAIIMIAISHSMSDGKTQQGGNRYFFRNMELAATVGIFIKAYRSDWKLYFYCLHIMVFAGK